MNTRTLNYFMQAATLFGLLISIAFTTSALVAVILTF